MKRRYAIDVYLEGKFDKRFYFSRKRDVMWARRFIALIGLRATVQVHDRWRGHEITD